MYSTITVLLQVMKVRDIGATTHSTGGARTSSSTVAGTTMLPSATSGMLGSSNGGAGGFGKGPSAGKVGGIPKKGKQGFNKTQ